MLNMGPRVKTTIMSMAVLNSETGNDFSGPILITKAENTAITCCIPKPAGVMDMRIPKNPMDVKNNA